MGPDDFDPKLTVGLHRKYTNLVIENLEAANAFLAAFDRDILRSRESNRLGKLLFMMGAPSYDKADERCREARAKADLLALTLTRRLAEKLTDPYTGQAYRRDPESGDAYSVGPDGEPGTEDDVRLGVE